MYPNLLLTVDINDCTCILLIVDWYCSVDINECTMYPNLCQNGLCQNLLKSGYRCLCDRGFQHHPNSETKCVGMYFNICVSSWVSLVSILVLCHTSLGLKAFAE